MFRVPLDTVLRRASVTSLLVLATALSACGDDKTEANSNDGQSALTADGGSVAEAPVGTTPAASTPATTPTPSSKKDDDDAPLQGEETNESVPGGIKAKKFSAKDAARITDKIENAASIAAQSDEKVSATQVKRQVTEIKKILEKSGRKVTEAPAGESGSLAIVKVGGVRVMFFDNARRATEVTRNYQQLISTRPGYGRADHRGTRMWILTDPDKYSKKDLAEYRDMRDSVEKEL